MRVLTAAALILSAGLVLAEDPEVAAPDEGAGILSDEADAGFLGLEGLDLTLRSRDRLFEMAFSGRLDVIVYGIPADGAGLLGHDHTFVHDRADLFVDMWVGDVLYAFADGRTDRGENPSDDSQVARMERYFLRLSLPGDFDLSVQVGKFSGVIGNYLPRHEGPQDNFLRYPIVYDHPTWMDWQNPPTSNDGQIGHVDFPKHADVGLPVVWQAYYATGGALFGSWEFLNWRFAAMNTAPSDRPESWGLDVDGHSDKFNFMGRLGVVPLFGLEAGLNVSRGPYLDEDAEARLDGRDRDDFDQILYGLDLAYSTGDLDLYMEVYRNEWEAHNIDGDLIVWAGYLEAKYTFVPGFYGAVRVGREQFSTIENSAGEDKTWDGNHTRYEIGAGYWIRNNLVIRGQVEFNQTERGRDLDDNVYSLGVGLSF